MSLLKKIKDKYGVIHAIGDSRVDAFETELTGGEHNVPYSPAVLSKTNAIEQKIDDHTSNLANPHKVTKEQLGLANVENKSSSQIRSEITKENVTNALGYTPIDESKIGAANGVASLDSSGRIPASQIPGGFDNIEEYDTLKSFPAKGEEGKIYVAKDTNLTYRWTGSQYVEISPSIALGETSKTAYRGDRGKIAYEHSQITGNTSIHHTHANKVLLDSYTQTEADLANAVAKVHEHGNKTVLDGITSDKVASWDSKAAAFDILPTTKGGTGTNASSQEQLMNTLINTLTVDSNTSKDNDYYVGQVAGGGTTNTTYKRHTLLSLWNYIKGKISSVLGLTASNYSGKAATAGTADKAVADNSGNNIVNTYATKTELSTHIGDTTVHITAAERTAWNAKADGNNSVAIFDGYMRRMNESAGWRRLAYKQFNYTNTNINALFRLYLFGSNNEHIGLGDLVVNVRFDSSGSAPELKTCYLMTHKPLNTLVKVRVIGVAGNAVVELWFRPMTFSMLTLTCLGNGHDITSSTKDWTFEKYIDATDPEPIEDVANNIYVFSGSERRIQTSIDNPTNGNLVAMDANGLVKDSGIRITSSDVANWNSKMDKQTVGNASEPVYIENGIAKVATNVATTGNLETKLNVDGSNATTEGVTAMMKKVESGSVDLTDDSYYFGDGRNDHTKIVRRPILNIWNYIAGKVQRQLLGSVGSADKPIYLENGVPKVCADGVPYSSVSYGGSVGYGVFVGGAHNLASTSRIYCTFLVTATLYNDNIAHTYIGTFTFREGFLNSELKCLTGTPQYPLRIVVVSNKDGGTTSDPTYTIGLYVIPPDKTTKYSGYNLTRISSNSDFIWDVKDISEATYDECNSVAKPALKPIILTWDAKGSNVSKTGGTWIPTFDKATIIDCRGIVDMSIQVDLSIIGQRTYIDDFTSYEITLVNSSKTDILPASLHQEGRMPRQARSSSSTIDGTIDISHTHRFIFPITSTTNLLAGYMPKITLPSRYTLDSGAQVSIKALCRGIVLPYGADEYF